MELGRFAGLLIVFDFCIYKWTGIVILVLMRLTEKELGGGVVSITVDDYRL